ncbi:glycerate kinase [Coprococcus sp. OM06-34AC]|nr:glycerate kinase [Coprococcus sp. OM06-34AC]RGI41995.1 glycerate kinase [Coprococcus sp. OM06-25]RHR65054.1 glycerate kinase [Coprococcus sp. AF16-5]RJV45340.1 glycerate kinase [Coprococcus sp. AF19-8AC]
MKLQPCTKMDGWCFSIQTGVIMKKILVAVDSFKGSMTSLEAGNAIKKGIKSILPDTEVRVRPVADGGEGTTDALIYGRDGVSRERCYVTGPLGDRITAEYTIYNAADGRTAVMEMAAAAGLPLVPENRRDPMHTTTYGVGEMINDAVSKGCERFIIGIGGSATNDGGIGMLQALGFSCLDVNGHEVPYGAEGLGVLERIVIPGKMLVRKNSSELAVADPVDTPIVGTAAISGAGAVDESCVDDDDFAYRLSRCTFSIACDVTNPLVGELGCSRVFAPQKGADAETVEIMDGYMKNYADVVERSAEGKSDRNTPGAGAAGGLGYAFLMFLGGKLMPGIDIVLSEIGLEADVEWADTVITGEGRIDAQTMMGKTPLGVAKLAKKHGKYVIAIGGCLGDGAENCVKEGLFNECYAVNNVLGIDDSDSEQVRTAMKPENAAANLTTCAAKITELKEQMSARVCRPALLR